MIKAGATGVYGDRKILQLCEQNGENIVESIILQA
jgi:hypothetical protein